MAIVFSCPQCRKPLSVPDSAAGGRVRCPFCRAVATAPGGPSAITSRPILPAPAPPLPAPTGITATPPRAVAEWQTVATGLTILATGMATVVLAGALMLVFVAIVTIAGLTPESGGFLFCCPIGVALIGMVVQVVGMFFGIAAPPDRGLQAWAIAGAIGSLVGGPIGYALFLFFLRGVAAQVHRPGLARGFLIGLVLVLAVPVFGCPFFFLVGTDSVEGARVNNAAAAPIQLALFLSVVALTGWLLWLVVQLRRALRQDTHAVA